ncbi:MFS transporter [Sphaerotilus mobilis]|uniref:Na+/melibiose symporter-like transporter n=1 Tax=Sphaerotilus mobilis TaxID=47994 RepID=A0A4Q7L9E6_9BURK|nr:MFS transporter [Sphaerotilus mobilis]RZS46697.1 Na+/melibiose symporter-like transporter [Sphaerotilus mobilis]
MTTLTSPTHSSSPRASWMLIFTIVLTYWALSMALLTPPMMTIALRVAEIAPQNKESTLGLLLGIGAVVSVFANPMAGYFSDRTVTRFGRRKSWMVAGGLIGFFGLWLISVGGVNTMIVGWCLTQLGMNAVAAALMALLPDQIPENQRGMVSGAIGMCVPAGIISGFALVNAAQGHAQLMFLLAPGILLVTIALLCMTYTDKATDPAAVAPFSLGQMLRDFAFNPKAHPDFTWAFLSRLFFFFALATFLGYQVFFLMDRLGYSAAEVPGIMVKVNLIASAIQIAASFLGGWLSDVIRRRKVFIWTSAVLYGVGLLIIARATNYDAFLLGACVMSLSFGVYFAVDVALVTEVLPDAKNNAAKDLGVMNVAGTLPQTLAPAIAPLFLFAGGSSTPDYGILFSAAAVYAVLGAVTIIPIRKVR